MEPADRGSHLSYNRGYFSVIWFIFSMREFFFYAMADAQFGFLSRMADLKSLDGEPS